MDTERIAPALIAAPSDGPRTECPEYGIPLLHVGGCLQCQRCGYGACG